MPTDSVFQSGRRVVNSPFSTGSEIVRSGSSAIPRPSSAARTITCVSFVRIRPFTSTSELSPSRSNFHRLPNRVLTSVGKRARSDGAVTGGRSARNAGAAQRSDPQDVRRRAMRPGSGVFVTSSARSILSVNRCAGRSRSVSSILIEGNSARNRFSAPARYVWPNDTLQATRIVPVGAED